MRAISDWMFDREALAAAQPPLTTVRTVAQLRARWDSYVNHLYRLQDTQYSRARVRHIRLMQTVIANLQAVSGQNPAENLGFAR